MNIYPLVIAFLVLPFPAFAESIAWQDYAVPETGSVAQVRRQSSLKTAESLKRDMEDTLLPRTGGQT